MATDLCMVRNGDEGRCSQTMPCPVHGATAPSTAPTLGDVLAALRGIEHQLARASSNVIRNECGPGIADLACIRGMIDGANQVVTIAAERLRRVLGDRQITAADRAVAADGRA